MRFFGSGPFGVHPPLLFARVAIGVVVLPQLDNVALLLKMVDVPGDPDCPYS